MSLKWFATQVDRDFKTGYYGDGIRLYIEGDPNIYCIIKGISFKDGKLIVQNQLNNEMIELSSEPNNELFENTILKQWKEWDSNYGLMQDEDRPDYEPWAYNSISGLAKEFKLLEKDEGIKQFYERSV